ncbi:V-type ATP synthase subunit E [uncultured Oscillibacter sp.]|uniref:V-type ATP synthase subunit E n=1 Tax=uncultured Oscillibacter sp. TaxID=876091 RepID=UPI0025D3EFF8|nr:V-type ATP synthase subunit E [uncultured Oscillibacter sp.]
MNGIEKIAAQITAEVQAEIDQTLAVAREEAAGVTARFQAQAGAEDRDLAARNEKAAAEREERLVSMAQMEARKVRLAAKQEMVEQAYVLALEKLCAMPDERYTEAVAELLVQAAPDGRGEVILAPEVRGRIGEAAVALANQRLGKGQLALSAESRPIRGGFILKRGNVEVNGTFETLVRLQRAETAGAVAKQLFPES